MTARIPQVVTVNFKFRADFDVTTASDDSHTNLLGFTLKDGAGADILLLKFEEGDNGLQINDGKDDFGTGGVVFAENAVYDISVTTEIGSNKYSYTAKGPDGVGGEAVASGTDFTLNSGTVNSFGQVSFYMNGPGGAGNDGFVDSITVDVTPVPEPSSTALLALGGIAMAFRRRK